MNEIVSYFVVVGDQLEGMITVKIVCLPEPALRAGVTRGGKTGRPEIST